MAIGRADYEERKEQKIDALEARAEKAREESLNHHRRAKKIADAIPFGQPILVGHHSETRHRADARRIETGMRRSVEADKKADYYQNRADTAADNRSISGDDPDAVKHYQKKLAELETAQEHMKAINKAWKSGTDALHALGLTDDDIAKLKARMPDYETKPFPSWALSNNSAEIRRVKQKLEALKKLDTMTTETIKFSGGEMRVDIDINRVQFIFDDKPPEEIRKLMKSHGFRWAPSEGAWQRQRTMNAVSAAKQIIAKIEETSHEGN